MLKNIALLTGGGDVPPLNAVIESVRRECVDSGINLIGFIRGWQGILNKDFVKLNNVVIDPLIGGTFLKSSRVNIAKIDSGGEQIEKILNELSVDGLIVIGGEDTLSNSLLIKNIPQVLISKTIDNDVGIISSNEIINYFTLGHPTASEKISSFVSMNEGLRTTAYSHERIIIVESMGMHAGWLALSSFAGAPDFIIIPEFPLDYEKFKEMLSERYIENKNAIVVIAEGARWSNGEYISADENETDEFGHPRFKGAATLLCTKLKNDLKSHFDTRNVNFVNPSYLYRSGRPNSLDLGTALEMGKFAVNLLKENIPNPVFLASKYFEGNFIIEKLQLNNIKNIGEFHRYIPEKFYNTDKFMATAEYGKYLQNFTKILKTVKYDYRI